MKQELEDVVHSGENVQVRMFDEPIMGDGTYQVKGPYPGFPDSYSWVAEVVVRLGSIVRVT